MSESIRFAHLADLHLGAYREKILTDLNLKTFKLAIQRVIELKVDFCLFAGDIFNHAMPPLELVQQVVEELMKLKKAGIPLYVIGGSHDYSNTGKSFIELLESAELFVDVSKYKTVDKNNVELLYFKGPKNTLISGILGKKNGLDKNLYSNLKSLENSQANFKIFMFHTTLNDIKPEFMKAVKSEVTSSLLPKGFNYYAGGHVHAHIESEYDGAPLSYPGPLFPNNFAELKREVPSFNLCEVSLSKELKITREFISTYEIESLSLTLNSETSIDAKDKIDELIDQKNLKNKIVLIEIKGVVDGTISDIRIQDCIELCYSKGALHVLRNTYKLTSKQVVVERVDTQSIGNLENEVLEKTFLESTYKDKEIQLVKEMLLLDLAKHEDEKNSEYEDRVKQALHNCLNNT